MTRYVGPVAMLLHVLACSAWAQEGDTSDPESETGVRIALTKLDVNDVMLKLQYRIENNSDRSIWVLRSIDLFTRSVLHDVFLSKDAKTLLVRRRLYMPYSRAGSSGIPRGNYVLLKPSEDLSETVSVKLPGKNLSLFGIPGERFVGQATRLRIEIGYYDEDLPELVRSILRGAAGYGDAPFTEEFEIEKEYFRGLLVQNWVGKLSNFDFANPAPYDDGIVIVRYSRQALTGEKVLTIEVDGLSIPYDGDIEYSSENSPPERNVDSSPDSSVGGGRVRGVRP